MKNINEKLNKYYPLIVLFIFCFILTFLMCFSPLAQGFGRGHDSAIFATVGNALNQGRVLYTEIVDNKGPLLYLINALGLSINYDFGMFYIEYIFLCLGSFFAYKTAMLITKKNCWVSCFSVMFAMLLFIPTLQGGNFTEEYAILFINIATYFIVKFIFNDYKLKKHELIIIGVCFAATFLLRANLCALYVAEIIVILFYMVKDKKYKEVLTSAIFIAIGGIAFVTPFVIYLINNNALSACLEMVYLGVRDSFGYISRTERIHKLGGLILLSDEVKAFSIIAFAFVIFLTKPKIEKPIHKILIISFFGTIITLYVNSLTGGPAWAYTHYFMAFIPILVIIYSWLFIHIHNLIEKNISNKNFKNIIILSLMFIVFISPVKSLFKEVVSRINIITPEKNGIVKYISENTLNDDTIQVISVDDTLYYPTKRIPTSRHIFFAGGFAEEKRKQDANELAEDLYNAKIPAKLIILPNDNLNNIEFVKSLTDKEAFIKYLNDNYSLEKKASEDFNCNIYKLNN